MVRFRPRQPGRAWVVGAVALVIALGGTGYAATGRPASSVRNTTLQNGAVATKRIAPNAIRSAHHARVADRARSARFFCTLPVTVTGRGRAIEQVDLRGAAAKSTNTTNSAGEAGL